MLHAGLDLSRKRLDVCLIADTGELIDHIAAPPDADGLRGLARRVARFGARVRGVIESMNGARFVHDMLEEFGWEVLIADAQKVKGLAPLAVKTDKIDARVLAELSWRDLVPAIWLPDPTIRRERELARYRLHVGGRGGAWSPGSAPSRGRRPAARCRNGRSAGTGRLLKPLLAHRREPALLPRPGGAIGRHMSPTWPLGRGSCPSTRSHPSSRRSPTSPRSASQATGSSPPRGRGGRPECERTRAAP
jgi:hypothetical protein